MMMAQLPQWKSQMSAGSVRSRMVFLGSLCVAMIHLSHAQLTSSASISANAVSSITLFTSFTALREVSTTMPTPTASSQSKVSNPSSSPTGSNGSDDNQDPDSDVSEPARSGLLNYYFAFLAFFVLLVFLGGYLIHRRRIAQKQRARNSGQNALARDLDGWTSTRRWMNGHWRSDSRLGGEEGLNELGQAPPPYVTKSDNRGQSEGVDHDIQTPLRVLPRDGPQGSHTKPPEYSEAITQP